MLTIYCPLFQVWFKNRRAKCRQQQKAAEQAAKQNNNNNTTGGGSTTGGTAQTKPASGGSSNSGATPTAPVKKPKSPPPSEDSSSPAEYKPSSVVPSSSPNVSSNIWSPASISPMGDLINSNSCMQRAGGYPSLGNSQAGYGTPQNYSHSGYYSNTMDYLSPMQLPVMTSSQMMTSSNMNNHASMNMNMNHMSSHMGGHMGSQMGSYGGLGSGQSLGRTHSSPTAGDCLDYKDSWGKFPVREPIQSGTKPEYIIMWVSQPWDWDTYTFPPLKSSKTCSIPPPPATTTTNAFIVTDTTGRSAAERLKSTVTLLLLVTQCHKLYKLSTLDRCTRYSVVCLNTHSFDVNLLCPHAVHGVM